MEKNLVLIGMMGSGKSTIGRIIAKNTKLKFYDVDKIIENENNLQISEIFKKKGEDYFRKLEENISVRILKSSKSIISLGGGAFLNSKIRNEIKINSISVWLKWGSDILIKRIKNSKTRPLVNKLSEKELIKLIDNRTKIYAKADYKIICDKLNKEKIVKKILEIYKNEKNNSKN
tara:strand:- start:1756 stop:2280 length:525 start_codon:yes stop_codon:yes gene_type:complete